MQGLNRGPEEGYRWKVLIAAFFATLTFAFVLQSVPPVLHLIIQDFRLTHTQAGLLMSLFALPMIFLSIPAGLLADRYGPRLTGLVAFLLTIAGTLLVALGPSFPLLLVGRALAGVGAFTLVLVGPQLLSQWFWGKEMGTAMGIFNSGMPMGSIASFVFMGSIGEAAGWRIPIFITAGIALVSLAVFALLVRSASHAKPPASAQGDTPARATRTGKPIWLLGLAWLFFNGSTLSFMAFAPDYFQAIGYSVARAGLFSSLIMWGSLLVAPIVGLALDRGLNKALPIAIGGIGIALALFLIPASPFQEFPLLVLLAVANGLVPVAVFAMPSDLLDRQMLGLGYGILSSLMNVGMFLGPFLAGQARDLSGNYTASFWIMSVLALLVLPSVMSVVVVQKIPWSFTRHQA